MVSDFEARLATVLGGRLPAPFDGTVSVGSDSDAVNASEPRIYVGVYKTESKPQGFGGNRTVALPDVTDRVRVIALTVYVNLNVLPAQDADRVQQLQGIEQLNYLLDEENFQTGAALVESGDQGFQIERMHIADGIISVDNGPDTERPPGLTLIAEGIFWPIGVSGETGIEINEIRLRGLVIDIHLGTELPAISAGDAPIDIDLRVTGATAHRIGNDATNLTFDQIMIDLQQEDGQSGAGVLSGGSPGSGTVRQLTLTEGIASFTYTPPSDAATDILLVGFDDGENGMGTVVNRFKLEIR